MCHLSQGKTDQNQGRVRLLTAILCAVTGGWLLTVAADVQGDDAPLRLTSSQITFRRPIGIVSIGNRIVTANRDSGSLSVIEPFGRGVVGEYAIGKPLSDVILIPSDESKQLAVLRSKSAEMVIVDFKTNPPTMIDILPAPTDPVRVAVGGTNRLAVTGRWSRQVFLYEKVQQHWQHIATTRLPFAPLALCFDHPGNQLLVADAFGGQLAVLQWDHPQRVQYQSIEGHNIRDISLSHNRQEVLIVHQLLHPHVETLTERIFWGNVINNFVRGIDWKELWEEGRSGTDSTPIGHWNLLPLGEPSHGTGDPSAIALAADGAAVVCLGGVDEIAIRPGPRQPMMRFSVGRFPSDVACSPDSRWAFIANQFDDSVTVVDLKEQKLISTISLGSQPKKSAIHRGESLFYDAKLSHDGWYSCHSCHTDGHTNNLLNDNLGDGTYGAPKRVLTLMGVAETSPWSWRGQRGELKKQIHDSIATTMRGPQFAASVQNIADIDAYIRSLKPPPGVAVARNAARDEKVARGKQVFTKLDCQNCHVPPRYTSSASLDIGMHDKVGNRNFNPPSLRAVSQRDRYFHDGRARTLEAAVRSHAGVDTSDLNDKDRQALIEFLRTL